MQVRTLEKILKKPQWNCSLVNEILITIVSSLCSSDILSRFTSVQCNSFLDWLSINRHCNVLFLLPPEVLLFPVSQIHLLLKKKNNPMFNSSWAARIRPTYTVKKSETKSPPKLELCIGKYLTFFLFSLQANEAKHIVLKKHLISVLLIQSYEFEHAYGHMPLLPSKEKCDYFSYISNFLVFLFPFTYSNASLLSSFLSDSWSLEIFIFINEILMSTWSRRYDEKAKSEAMKLGKIGGVSHSTISQAADTLRKWSSVISLKCAEVNRKRVL